MGPGISYAGSLHLNSYWGPSVLPDCGISENPFLTRRRCLIFHLAFFSWDRILTKTNYNVFLARIPHYISLNLWLGFGRSSHLPLSSCYSWDSCPFLGLRYISEVLAELVLTSYVQGGFSLSKVHIDPAVWGQHLQSTDSPESAPT